MYLTLFYIIFNLIFLYTVADFIQYLTLNIINPSSPCLFEMIPAFSLLFFVCKSFTVLVRHCNFLSTASSLIISLKSSLIPFLMCFSVASILLLTFSSKRSNSPFKFPIAVLTLSLSSLFIMAIYFECIF